MNILFFSKEQAVEKYLNSINYILKNSKIISLDNYAKEFLDSKKIKNTHINEYVDFDSNKISTDWSNNWIYTNKEFFKGLTYEGMSIAWLLEIWTYDTVGYKHSVQDVITSCALIKSVIKKEKPKKIRYYHNNDLVSKTIELFPNVEKLGKKKNYSINIKNYFRLKTIKYFFRTRYILRKSIWTISKLLSIKKNPEFSNNTKRKKILIFSPSVDDKYFDPIEKKIKKGDPYISPIISYLNQSNEFEYIIYDLYTYKNLISIDTIKRILKNDKFTLFENETIDFKKILLGYKKINSEWKNKTRSKDFEKSFMYEGINIGKILKPQFLCYFDIRLIDHLIYYEVLNSTIIKNKPKLVVFPSETGDLLRMCSHSCKKHDVKSIGLQHGAVDYTPMTIHKFKQTKDFEYPIPTVTSMYGDFYRDFLIKGGYPKDAVASCGNPKYDMYKYIPKTIDEKKIKKEMGFDEKKKIVFFPSYPVTTKPEMYEVYLLIFEYVKKNDYQLIVKMHPKETSKLTYEELGKKFKIKNMRIFSGYDSLKLIKASDMVIGPETTLNYEAMILNKPVVILNLSGQADEMEFTREGAALSVKKKEEFETTVNKLKDPKTKRLLNKKMKQFVYNQCNKIDGNSSKRVVDVIKRLTR